jgi:hypothetical protein
MSIRTRIAALAGAAALVVAGVVAISSASADGTRPSSARHGWPTSTARAPHAVVHAARASAKAEGTHVVAVIEKERRSAFVDVGDPGDSAGDYFLFESDLLNNSGDVVGRDSVKCTLGVRTFICDATGTLFHRGKLTAYGAFFGENDARLAITGGTGAFKEAGGQVTVADQADGTTLLVFEITG